MRASHVRAFSEEGFAPVLPPKPNVVSCWTGPEPLEEALQMAKSATQDPLPPGLTLFAISTMARGIPKGYPTWLASEDANYISRITEESNRELERLEQLAKRNARLQAAKAGAGRAEGGGRPEDNEIEEETGPAKKKRKKPSKAVTFPQESAAVPEAADPAAAAEAAQTAEELDEGDPNAPVDADRPGTPVSVTDSPPESPLWTTPKPPPAIPPPAKAKPCPTRKVAKPSTSYWEAARAMPTPPPKPPVPKPAGPRPNLEERLRSTLYRKA